MEVTILSYGATIQSMLVRDKAGRHDDVITGYDDIEGYLSNSNMDGALVGRYANRIGRAEVGFRLVDASNVLPTTSENHKSSCWTGRCTRSILPVGTRIIFMVELLVLIKSFGLEIL